MTRWLPRSLWLLAWSFWAWLGWGLYRELPRELGAISRQIHFDRFETPQGFLPDWEAIATLHVPDGNGPTTIRVYDSISGAVVRSFKGPQIRYCEVRDPFDRARRFDLRRGVLLTNAGPPNEAGKSTPGLHVLEVVEGRWRRIGNEVDFAELHETHPWVLFRERLPGDPWTKRLAVVDYESGELLFEDRCGPDFLVSGQPFFLPGTDDLIVPKKSSEENAKRAPSGRFEVYSLRERRTSRIIESEFVDLGARARPSACGLVAFSLGARPFTAFDVVDLHTGKHKGTFPPEAKTGPIGPKPPSPFQPVVSASGRRVLGGSPPTLWDVETSRVLWTRMDGTHFGALPAENLFVELEQWGRRLESTFGNQSWLGAYDTVAWRDLESGQVNFRTWYADSGQFLQYRPGDPVAISADGSVYRQPFHVAWVQLAICQAILALPLIILWTILRWRRNRRLRLASVQS